MKIKIHLKKNFSNSANKVALTKIKLKSIVPKTKIKKVKKGEVCPICDQIMDLCVTSHKNKPFIDNKCYPKICFTCYHVPKITEQKYDEKGYILEEVSLDYSIKNLHSPEELFNSGSADSLEYAKKSVRAIKKLEIAKGGKEKKNRPNLEYYLTNYEI